MHLGVTTIIIISCMMKVKKRDGVGLRDDSEHDRSFNMNGRVVPYCSVEFIVLQDTIKKCFLLALFDGILSAAVCAAHTPSRSIAVLDPTSMPTEISVQNI